MNTHPADGLYGLSVNDVYDGNKLDLCHSARNVFAMLAHGKRQDDLTTEETTQLMPVTLELLLRCADFADEISNDFDVFNNAALMMRNRGYVTDENYDTFYDKFGETDDGFNVAKAFMDMLLRRAKHDGLIKTKTCPTCGQDVTA